MTQSKLTTPSLTSLFLSEFPYPDLVQRAWDGLADTEVAYGWNVSHSTHPDEEGLACKVERVGRWYDISVLVEHPDKDVPMKIVYNRRTLLGQED